MTRFACCCGIVFAIGAIAAPVAAQNHIPGHCIPLVLQVALAPGARTTASIAGTFCTPLKANPTHTVDVLVHGATYDRSYWDSPFHYPDYSYVARTLAAGRAVVFYDRLGVGRSSTLPSASVTIGADAEALHQILDHFRPQFRAINLIGHSYGSRVAQVETATYNDATRLVLTDNLHAFGAALAKGLIMMRSTSQDSVFAGMHLDAAWMTTTPGASRDAFYYLPGADPAEIAYDDAHRSIVSATQFQEGAAIGRVPADSNVSGKITRPVLLVLGEEDGLYCGLALDCSSVAAVTANERPFYQSAASLAVVIVPNTGHDLALHRSAGASFEAINRWLEGAAPQ